MKNKTNLILDICIFAGFLLAMEPRITGENIHEWFSVALAVTIVFHLLLHWDWIINVAKKYFIKLWHTSRLNFFLDVLLFVGFNTIMLSGFLISRSVLPSLGIRLGGGNAWRLIHSQSADITLWLVAVHFGLHWRWLWTMVKKYTVAPLSRLFSSPSMGETVPIEIEDDLAER
jgi:hypothetical protein